MNIITTILNNFIGKELDETLIKVIESSLELQNKTLQQLKEDNVVLKNNISLLEKKSAQDEQEKETLVIRTQQLESQLTTAKSEIKFNQPSEVETAILSSCLNTGIAGFCSEDMVVSLPFSRLEVTNAIDQLERKGILQISSLAPQGSFYSISPSGKKLELELEKNDYSY